MKLTLAAALMLTTAAALTGPASAQVVTDAKAVQAGTYMMDPDHTQVFWAINHLGFTEYQGQFQNPTGSLTVDPKTPANDAIDVTIPVEKIYTPSAKLNGELVSPTWFDAQKYPSITFKSTKVVPGGKGTARVTGDLTMHGVTKPVTLDVKFVGVGPNPFFKVYSVGFTATGTLKRSDFGVSFAIPALSDETKLTLNATFVKP